MDEAGLFFPLSDSTYFFKLSNTKGSGPQKRVFTVAEAKRTGSTMSVILPAEDGEASRRLNINTKDTLGSKDLLMLQWYMDSTKLMQNKGWSLEEAGFPSYVKKNGRAIPLHENQNDISEEGCHEAYRRLLEICNDIRSELKQSPLDRLPPDGAAGLIFFLCRSRSHVPLGPLRRWCQQVIHHFDPDKIAIESTNDNAVEDLTKQMAQCKVKGKKVTQSTKNETTTTTQPTKPNPNKKRYQKKGGRPKPAAKPKQTPEKVAPNKAT